MTAATATYHPGQQTGSISLLALLVLVPAVLLLAFIVSTAQQSFRKQELQAAADAGALGAATTVARGLNVIAATNKGMADVLSVMISVRAMKETAPVMAATAGSMAAAAFAAQMYPLGEWLTAEAAGWASFGAQLSKQDNYLSNNATGFGWETMRLLDRANQLVKAGLPATLEVSALHYARENGSTVAYAVNAAPALLPRMPLGRGGEEYIAVYAQQCSLEATDGLTRAALFGGCSLYAKRPCMTALIAMGVHKAFQQQIVGSLGGRERPPSMNVTVTSEDVGSARTEEMGSKSIVDLIAEENAKRRQQDPKAKDLDVRELMKPRSYQVTSTMRWPLNPPLPMMLAADAETDADWTIPDPRAPLNANKVRRDLEFLLLSRGPVPETVVGGEWFKPGRTGNVLMYAQAEVFNPQDWYLFDQNWRARLSRSSLLEEKLQQLASQLGLPLPPIPKDALRTLNHH